MPALYVAESRRAIQYTGSNSAEIDSAISDFSIDSEAGGVLTVTSGGNQYVANTTDWFVFWQGVVSVVLTDTNLNTFYIVHPVEDDFVSLQDQIDTLSGSIEDLGGEAVRSVGVASAGTLLLGFPQNVAVQLIPAMPDSSYTADAYIFGTGVNLSQVTINSVTVTDADTVTVNVSTSLASLPGVHVLVVAKD